MTHPYSPLTNRTLLVTGGTGSFGAAFVRHALNVGATRVAVFSRDENKQFHMARELRDERLRFFIGDVKDPERIALAASGVDILVHAAAMKQIPACEQDPKEAKENNIDGTLNVAMAAIDAGVERAVLLSTDKAAAPNTHYGACKLVAERLWNRANVYAAGTRTRLCCTRYGNVVGSRGSVIPVFREQAKLGVLTITDKSMTRFWMTLADAVQLVETAIRKSRGGEVFVPVVAAANILTVAEAVAPGVPWTEIGIRRGEKLHEVLISEDEARDIYNHGDHYRIEPDRTWEHLPPSNGTPIPGGFSLRSNTTRQMDVAEMRELIQEA